MLELWNWKTCAVLAINLVIFSLLEIYFLKPYLVSQLARFLFTASVSLWSGYWARKTFSSRKTFWDL